ncbi:MAG: 30S ribosomal protein S16, partial [SAR324 cluster bacterium]|nr:30S ribosomal protein S16 [SAR324 cluster bacterium]
MTTRIRLARGGSKKRPFYRIVVADKAAPRDGRYVERIGSYNPLLENNKATFDKERAEYWLGVGARPSDRVVKLMSVVGIEVPAKLRDFKPPAPAKQGLIQQQLEEKRKAALEAKEKAAKAKEEAAKERAAKEKAAKEEAAKAEAAKEEAAKAEAAKEEAAKAEAAKEEAAKAEAAQEEDAKAAENEKAKAAEAAQ